MLEARDQDPGLSHTAHTDPTIFELSNKDDTYRYPNSLAMLDAHVMER
jgi:hypothetical protein